MADSAHQKTAHGCVDHGFGDVDASFVVAHEAAPVCEPAEGSASRLLSISPKSQFDRAGNQPDSYAAGGATHDKII